MQASSVSSRRVVAALGRSVLPRQLPTPCQLRPYMPARGLHGGSSLGARLVALQRGLLQLCWVAANPDSSDDELIPRWALKIISAVDKVVAASEKATEASEKATEASQQAVAASQQAVAASQQAVEASAASEKDSKKTREMLGVVLEVAVRNLYSQLGVKGAGTVLQSVDDMLQFLLPCRILLAAAEDQEFFRAMRGAITASLLVKDTGFLNAVIVLLKGEGMEQEAGQVEAVLRSGAGIEAASEGLRTVQRCLQAVESRAKAKGLGNDIRQLYTYGSAASTQVRAELLETTLFVRCLAATLRGSYTGVLEVDAGAGMGCEVDEGAGALRLRAGETKYSPGEMDAADEQLQTLFLVAAFTLDKVLAAAAAAPAASKAAAELKQLPRCFILDGFCVYAGTASKQQLQRRQSAADRRTVADASVIGNWGLQSAVLQVQFQSARYTPL